jgi:transposase
MVKPPEVKRLARSGRFTFVSSGNSFTETFHVVLAGPKPTCASQMSDYKGAALLLSAMPAAKELLADKGYDADWFRAALARRGVAACIPSKSNCKAAIPFDAVLYRQRHKIENMFGRLQRLATHPHPI